MSPPSIHKHSPNISIFTLSYNLFVIPNDDDNFDQIKYVSKDRRAGFVRKIEQLWKGEYFNEFEKRVLSLETRLDAFDGSIRQAKGGNSTRSKFRLAINIVTFDGGDDDRDRAGRKMETGNQSGNRAHRGRSLVSNPIRIYIQNRTCKV